MLILPCGGSLGAPKSRYGVEKECSAISFAAATIKAYLLFLQKGLQPNLQTIVVKRGHICFWAFCPVRHTLFSCGFFSVLRLLAMSCVLNFIITAREGLALEFYN